MKSTKKNVIKKRAKRPVVRRGRGKGQVGRPIELTQAILARIAKHVAAGNYIETASDLEGVSIHSIRHLMRDGIHELRRMAIDQDTEPSDGLARAVRFSREIKKARAKAERDDLNVLRAAGRSGQWQACAWRLERRQPDRWARCERHEHSGPGGAAIPFFGTAVTPEQLKNLSEEELHGLRDIVTKLSKPTDA